MRTKLRGKVTLLFMTCAVLLAIPAVAAIADELRSSHNTFTADVRDLALQSGGATDTVTVRLQQQNNDNEQQCNVDLGEILTIKAQSDNPNVATVKWADSNSDTTQFVGCAQGSGGLFDESLTVTSGSAGSANVTFSIVTNTTGQGTYDLTSRAPFTVTVASPPNTAPQVEVTGVADGASYEKGSVPNAGCTVVDAEDSNESASPVKDSSALNSYGLGLETVTCSYTDGGNLTTTVRATYSIVDTTKPVIAPHDDVSANAANANGAVVNYTPPTANDAVYGPVPVTCVPASGSTFPLGDTTVTCTATDGSGNTQTSTFKVTVSDATPPIITPNVQGTLGNDSWYRSDVALTWTVVDNESTISNKTGCDPITITQDQSATNYTCSATSAGGPSTKTVSIKRDATAPVVTAPASGVSGTAGQNGWYTSVVSQTFNASDATSGLAGPASFTRDSDANEEGQNVNIPSGPVSDNAGNTNTASAGPFMIDLTDPTIQASLSPQNPASSGWYNAATGAPTVSFTCSDAVSGLEANACPADHTFGNGENQSHSGTVTDRAGRSATADVTNVDVDLDAPTISDDGRKSDPDGTNDWYVSEAFNKFSASDGANGSGLADASKANFEVGTGNREGSGLTVESGSVSDNAGNTASSKTSTASFDVDLTNPTIQASLSPQNPASSGWYNAATGAPTVSFTCSDKDPGSGLATGACPADFTFENGENQSKSGTVTDRAGRKSDEAGVNNVDVDLDPPNAPTATTDPLDPVANSGGFFKDTVKVSYGGSTDVGPSGVKGYSNAQTFSSTGTHDYSGKATDNAGNESTATSGQVKVDAGVPTLTINGCPTNPVVLNSTQNITIAASDDTNGSGLVSNPSGSVSLDTSFVGSKSKTITVEDKVGHTKSETCNYSVKYEFGGFLQPINYTAHQVLDSNVSTFKLGSTVPVKFQLKDATGKVVQAGNAQWITPQKGSSTSQAVDETVYTESAMTGTLYKWDATSQQYHYNWSTKGSSSGFYYKIGVKLDDGQTYYTYISLR